jgi:hypothetical protein
VRNAFKASNPLFRRNVHQDYHCDISSGPAIMDSQLSPFQSALAPQPLANVPSRSPGVMPAGEIVAWTPSRMLWAFGAWLMEETQLPAPLAVNSTKRRA